MPFAEIAGADASGEIQEFYQRLIRDIYVKWADTRSLPYPPPLPRD